MTRLLEHYQNEVKPKLMEELGRKNPMAVPSISKIVVNMGVGQAVQNRKRLEDAMRDLATITGQKPAITKARRSVSSFRLREGTPIGCKVTLHGKRMYEFLDRLISIAIPRIRDFRGLSRDAFDSTGNYSLGLEDQIIFPEINIDKVEFAQGMDVTLVTTAKNDEEGYRLLKLMGMPLRS